MTRCFVTAVLVWDSPTEGTAQDEDRRAKGLQRPLSMYARRHGLGFLGCGLMRCGGSTSVVFRSRAGIDESLSRMRNGMEWAPRLRERSVLCDYGLPCEAVNASPVL